MTAVRRPTATVVKLRPHTHAKLQEIARLESRSMGDVVADLVDSYDEASFWKRVREQLAELKSDPVAWKSYTDEIAMWDGMAGDGLEQEEPYYSPEEAREILNHAERRSGR